MNVRLGKIRDHLLEPKAKTGKNLGLTSRCVAFKDREMSLRFHTMTKTGIGNQTGTKSHDMCGA